MKETHKQKIHIKETIMEFMVYFWIVLLGTFGFMALLDLGD